jgi:hypothetical protein
MKVNTGMAGRATVVAKAIFQAGRRLHPPPASLSRQGRGFRPMPFRMVKFIIKVSWDVLDLPQYRWDDSRSYQSQF